MPQHLWRRFRSTKNRTKPLIMLLLVFCGLFPVKGIAAGDSCQVKETLSESGTSLFELSNDAVQIVVNGDNGRIVSLKDAKGNEHLQFVALDYNWNDATGKPHFGSPESGKARILENTPQRVAVEFTKAGSDKFPLGVSIRYTVVAGVSGVYYSARLEHAASAPACLIGQLRVCLVSQPGVFSSGRTRQLSMGVPDADKLDRAVQLFPREAAWMTTGVIDCKYDWAVFSQDLDVYGLLGNDRGLWMIQPTREYLNGGPTQQELTLHGTGEPLGAPVLVAMFQGCHFSDGHNTVLSFEKGESWAKSYGPVLILANSGSPEEMWKSALAQTELEKKQWPYSWSESSPPERLDVVGRLLDENGKGLNGAQIVLGDAAKLPPELAAPRQLVAARSKAVPLQGEPSECVQWIGKQPWFSAESGEDGSFTIPKVIEGNYTLYAWKDGRWESLRKDDLIIQADSNDLGTLTFPAPETARLLWQIGIPNRSAEEFYRGDEPRHFGRHLTYPEDFPNGISFDVTTDDPAKAWNWAIFPMASADGTLSDSIWKVRFPAQDVPPGRGLLTIALAASSPGSKPVAFRLNGQEIFTLPRRVDTTLWFGATEGNYQVYKVPFDISLLKPDGNTLEIEAPNGAGHQSGDYAGVQWPYQGVIWDALKMEVHANPPPFETPPDPES
jgi:rhamnogalacturonan endolyase